MQYLGLTDADLAEIQAALQELDFETYADYNSLFWPAGALHTCEQRNAVLHTGCTGAQPTRSRCTRCTRPPSCSCSFPPARLP